MTRSWDHILPEADRDIYELAGFAHPGKRGVRPAVLVIDVQYRTVGDRPMPIREAIQTMYRTACGETGWRAVYNIATLLAVARELRLPVLYPCVAPKTAMDAGRFADKNPGIASIPDRGYEFVEEVAPKGSDLVLPKRHASAFFGTPLVSHLIDLGVDTLLLTGATTSGCVRATAADAFSYNFDTVVVEDCVFDRIEVSHLVSLFDINAKYADVLGLKDAVRYLETLGNTASLEA